MLQNTTNSEQSSLRTNLHKKKKSKEKMPQNTTNSEQSNSKTNSRKEKLERNKLLQNVDYTYVSLPAEKRFLVLYTLIKKNMKRKMIIILNSWHSVDYFQNLLDKINCPVTGIHENLEAIDKKPAINKYKHSKSGVFLCTENMIKYLKLNHDTDYFIIQYDPPNDHRGYIERLRTIPRNMMQHLLFVTEEEYEFIRCLGQNNFVMELLDITWAQVANVQNTIEKLVDKDYYIYLGAKQAFSGYVKAYNSNSAKVIFDINKLDWAKAAKCFGFTVPPFVDIEGAQLEEETAEKRKLDSESDPPKKKKKFKRNFVHIKS